MQMRLLRPVQSARYLGRRLSDSRFAIRNTKRCKSTDTRAREPHLFGAAFLIIERNGTVLLQRRRNTGFADGLWALVGGHMEPFEGIKEAMMREAKEELGLDIPLTSLRVAHMMHRGSFSAKPPPDSVTRTRPREYLDFYLWLHDSSLTEYCAQNTHILNAEPAKCSEMRFVPLAEMDTLPMMYHTKHAIRHILNQKYIGVGQEEHLFSERDLK